jgi:hypothetical protein
VEPDITEEVLILALGFNLASLMTSELLRAGTISFLEVILLLRLKSSSGFSSASMDNLLSEPFMLIELDLRLISCVFFPCDEPIL